jgi:hypothetical protein
MLLASILAEGESPTMMLVAMGGLVFLLWWTSMRRRTGSASPAPKRSRLDKTREELHQTQPHVTAMMARLEEVSREMMAQLDTRFSKLERSIADADERIGQLKALLREARGVGAVDVTLDDGEESGDGDVLRLSRAGLAPRQIAERTGRPLGEVELILSLARARRQGSPGEGKE